MALSIALTINRGSATGIGLQAHCISGTSYFRHCISGTSQSHRGRRISGQSALLKRLFMKSKACNRSIEHGPSSYE